MKNTVATIPLLLGLAALKATEMGILSSEACLPKQATDQCMGSLSKGQTSEAFVELFKCCWPNKAQAMAEATSLAADFRRATNQVESDIGNRLPGEYEFLGTRRLGMTYLTLVY